MQLLVNESFVTLAAVLAGARVYHKTDATICFSTDYHCQDGCIVLYYPGSSDINSDDGINGQDWLVFTFPMLRASQITQ
ncbi:hypothetical protein C8R45DRAFT_1106923 [Mycena sanguinolenta]|nr:hypothetical protein C8R45DRAFT_1106923 [Mycena sanguinolenta]